jgi:hypothetical protein
MQALILSVAVYAPKEDAQQYGFQVVFLAIHSLSLPLCLSNTECVPFQGSFSKKEKNACVF